MSPSRESAEVDFECLSSGDLVVVLSHCWTPEDLARCACVCKVFREALLPALRLRRERAGVDELPAELPSGFASWTAKLMFDERVKARATTVSVGHSHGLATHAGRVYVWGTEYVSSQGREMPGLLGEGLRQKQGFGSAFANDIHAPTGVPYIAGAVSVSCGREHSLALTDTGDVMAWGNGEWGACGKGPGRPRYDRFPATTQPPYLRGKQVYCDSETFGNMKHAYWTYDALYSIVDDGPTAGCAECPDCGNPPVQFARALAESYTPEQGGHPYGPFGMNASAFVIPVPVPLRLPLRVVQVAAGAMHSLLLGENGSVYALGCAYEGRLGLGLSGDKVPQHVVTPTKIKTGALASGAKVVHVTACDRRSLAVRSDGSVVGWGGESASRLGLGADGDAATPKPGGAEAPQRRRKGAASSSKAAAATAFYAVPVALPLPEGVRIDRASIADTHALLVARDGSVLSFGGGAGGALGNDADETDRSTATPIAALAGVRIATCAAGWAHSLVATTDGTVYEFGVEEGLSREDWDDDRGEEDEEDEDGPPPHTRGLPMKIGDRQSFGWWGSGRDDDWLKGLKATGIACGMATSALRAETGLCSSGGHECDSFPEFVEEAWPEAEDATEGEEHIGALEEELEETTRQLRKEMGLDKCVIC